jgi:hypothetical protein
MAKTTSTTCAPRYATRRRPERGTRGGEVAKVAAALGKPLLPWQREVVDVALEVDRDGVPYYRTVVVLTPRQSGKSLLTLALMLHRAALWSDERQLVVFGAQDGLAARKKVLLDWAPIVDASALAPLLKPGAAGRVQAAGREALVLRNKSRVEVIGSSESAAHGRSIDLAVSDEAWRDIDDRRDVALVPAMSTRPEAQHWLVSTAGTEASTYLRGKVDAGRAAALDELGDGVAYFEWSAPDDTPVDDPATWRACMPALGALTTEPIVRDALRSMSEDAFRRSYLNQWVASNERVIPAEVWERSRTDVALGKALTFAVDVGPGRFASVAAVDSDGVGELLRYGAGTSWVTDYVAPIAKERRARVAINTTGPAGVLVPELERGVRRRARRVGRVPHAPGRRALRRAASRARPPAQGVPIAPARRWGSMMPGCYVCRARNFRDPVEHNAHVRACERIALGLSALELYDGDAIRRSILGKRR